MNHDIDCYDFFVSYARADNTKGWITQFITELKAEHAKVLPGRPPLKEFFDKNDIRAGRDWEHTLHQGIARSRLFLAFISPSYFASEWCRREWRAWIDTEIAKHILTGFPA
ncbi:MAG: toll/interleukin-1 receptor domain-containing protein [Verrucomicrobiia bacterium]